MPIPKLNERGFLPHGIHECALSEIKDRFGKFHVLHAEDLLAVAIQHENDHLDGVLFVDRLSPLKRRLIKRKLSKVVTL